MFGLSMGWRHLLFEHYAVDPAIIAERLPDSLAVDTFDGDAYLTVVPYLNVDVRPRGLPARLGVALPELNLRTYVRHDGEPGVYFFTLDAEGVAGVLGGRLMHSLRYRYADIDVDAEPLPDRHGSRVRFESRRRHPGAADAAYAATYEPTGGPVPPEPGSLTAFLTDRYRFFADGRRGLRTARVAHGPWPLQPATATVERNDLFAAEGFEEPTGEPLRQYCRGVDVTTGTGERAGASGSPGGADAGRSPADD